MEEKRPKRSVPKSWLDDLLNEVLNHPEPISDECTLMDLGIDSLGVLTLMMTIEDELGVLLPIERLIDVRTVGDIRAIARDIPHTDDGVPGPT